MHMFLRTAVAVSEFFLFQFASGAATLMVAGWDMFSSSARCGRSGIQTADSTYRARYGANAVEQNLEFSSANGPVIQASKRQFAKFGNAVRFAVTAMGITTVRFLWLLLACRGSWDTSPGECPQVTAGTPLEAVLETETGESAAVQAVMQQFSPGYLFG